MKSSIKWFICIFVVLIEYGIMKNVIRKVLLFNMSIFRIILIFYIVRYCIWRDRNSGLFCNYMIVDDCFRVCVRKIKNDIRERICNIFLIIMRGYFISRVFLMSI